MNLIKHLSPLIIAAAIFLIVLIKYLAGNDVNEVKSDVALLTLPLVAGCLMADYLLKKTFKQKLLWIWLTELLLLLTVIYLWIIAE